MTRKTLVNLIPVQLSRTTKTADLTSATAKATAESLYRLGTLPAYPLQVVKLSLLPDDDPEYNPTALYDAEMLRRENLHLEAISDDNQEPDFLGQTAADRLENVRTHYFRKVPATKDAPEQWELIRPKPSDCEGVISGNTRVHLLSTQPVSREIQIDTETGTETEKLDYRPVVTRVKGDLNALTKQALQNNGAGETSTKILPIDYATAAHRVLPNCTTGKADFSCPAESLIQDILGVPRSKSKPAALLVMAHRKFQIPFSELERHKAGTASDNNRASLAMQLCVPKFRDSASPEKQALMVHEPFPTSPEDVFRILDRVYQTKDVKKFEFLPDPSQVEAEDEAETEAESGKKSLTLQAMQKLAAELSAPLLVALLHSEDAGQFQANFIALIDSDSE